MKKIIIGGAIALMPFAAFADGNDCGWQQMMGNSGMMGSVIGTPLLFIAPLISFAFWVLVLALLAGLVRWVWKKGDEKK